MKKPANLRQETAAARKEQSPFLLTTRRLRHIPVRRYGRFVPFNNCKRATNEQVNVQSKRTKFVLKFTKKGVSLLRKNSVILSLDKQQVTFSPSPYLNMNADNYRNGKSRIIIDIIF